MTIDFTKIGDSGTTTATKNAASGAATNALTGSQNIGKDEFLKMLVTQLKNQDPMDPMKSDDFAVNLAQFSQLEQLISINGKIGGGGTDSASSLASYLGTAVVTKGDSINVKDGNGGQLRLNLVQDASDVTIELKNSSGVSVGTLDAGALTAGKHTVDLSQLKGIADGQYSFSVAGKGLGGGDFTPDAAIVGTVTGFIPGATPTLLIGDREVTLSDITEVSLPATTAQNSSTGS